VNRLIKAIERARASSEQKALPSAAATASVAQPVAAGNSKSKDLRDTSVPLGTSKLSVAPVATVPKRGSAKLGVDIEALVPPVGRTGPVADESPAHISSRSRRLPLHKDKVLIAIIVTGLLILGAAVLYLGHKREMPSEKVSESTQAEKKVAIANPEIKSAPSFSVWVR
jgi:hypothetical protein